MITMCPPGYHHNGYNIYEAQAEITFVSGELNALNHVSYKITKF